MQLPFHRNLLVSHAQTITLNIYLTIDLLLADAADTQGRMLARP